LLAESLEILQAFLSRRLLYFFGLETPRDQGFGLEDYITVEVIYLGSYLVPFRRYSVLNSGRCSSQNLRSLCSESRQTLRICVIQVTWSNFTKCSLHAELGCKPKWPSSHVEPLVKYCKLINQSINQVLFQTENVHST